MHTHRHHWFFLDRIVAVKLSFSFAQKQWFFIILGFLIENIFFILSFLWLPKFNLNYNLAMICFSLKFYSMTLLLTYDSIMLDANSKPTFSISLGLFLSFIFGIFIIFLSNPSKKDWFVSFFLRCSWIASLTLKVFFSTSWSRSYILMKA